MTKERRAMKRRQVLRFAAATLAAAPLARLARAQSPVTVRWWYHFDNPSNSPAELIAKFESQNPGIKIAAESIPWGGGSDYATRLFTSVLGGSGPDCAMVK